MCLWNEPPQVSEMVVSSEFEWKYHVFLSMKTGILLLNSYLGLNVKIFSGGPCIRVSETSLSKCLGGSPLMNLSGTKKFFLNIKTREWNLKILLLNYLNDLALCSVETYFLKVGGYVFCKLNTTGVWEGRFCWICLKIPQFLKHKNGRVTPKDFIV